MKMKRQFYALLIVVIALVAFSASAQKESPLRTVRGQVVDRDEKPLPTAIVYLENMKTQKVSTHIADDGGSYRFSGLDPNVDYEIHAEHQGMSSAKRSISTLESRNEIIIQLKVDKK